MTSIERRDGSSVIVLDEGRCVSCGICAEVCGLDVISRLRGGRPSIDRKAFCNACGHCVALCPRGALSFELVDQLEFAPVGPSAISPTEMRSFLLAKRSCREFQDRPVARPAIEELVAVARTAPSAINCQERGFIIVDDRQTTAALRFDLAKQVRSMLGIIKLAGSKAAALFLDPGTVAHMRNLRADFEVALRHTVDGDDYIFHGAPCLVFFTGIAMDPAGKDHALAAQHYFMLYAEAMGLGTCINGYAQSFPKVLAKRLAVPKFHEIFGAVMLGYRKYEYKRTVHRKEALVVG